MPIRAQQAARILVLLFLAWLGAEAAHAGEHDAHAQGSACTLCQAPVCLEPDSAPRAGRPVLAGVSLEEPAAEPCVPIVAEAGPARAPPSPARRAPRASSPAPR